MNLQLQLSTKVALPGEPIPATVSVTSGAEPLRLPVLPDESNALVVIVYSPTGEVVTQANGHDRVRQKGFGAEPMAVMPTDELPPHQMGQVQFDLLDFVDLSQPGDYLVSVAIQFEGINIESQRIPLRILDSCACEVEIQTGRVCVPCLYTAVIYQHATFDRTVVTICNGMNPKGVLARTVADAPAGTRPRLSIADFTNSEEIDGDMTRWLAWMHGGNLCLVRLQTAEPAGQVLKPTLRFKAHNLLGRPIQHADGGITTFLTEDASHRIHAIRCDTTGVATQDVVCCLCTSPARPAVVTARPVSAVEIAVAADASFPISLLQSQAGRSRILTVEDPRDPVRRHDSVRIDVLRLFAGTAPREAGSIGAAYVVGSSPSTFWILRAAYPHFSNEGTQSTAPPTIPAPEPRTSLLTEIFKVDLPKLDEGETITAVDIAQSTAVHPPTNAPSLLFAVAMTSAGRVFSGMVGGHLELMKQADLRSQVAPSLVTAQDGSVYLGMITIARGFELVRVHEPPIY
jgi:hypothetical protein